jgi:hypothetical protein
MTIYTETQMVALKQQIYTLEEELRQLHKDLVPPDNPFLRLFARQHAALLMGLYRKQIATYPYLDMIGAATGHLGRGEGEDYAHHRVKVAMHKLRKKLREHGIEVGVIRGVGYFLNDENKAKVKKMMEKANDPST